MHNFLIIFLITYLDLVYCFKNNNRLRKNTERVNQIRSFNNTLSKIEGDLNFSNNTNQRSLFGTGDDVLLYDGWTSELDIGKKIYFKNGYFAIIGYKPIAISGVWRYNYYYFLFDNNGHRLVDYIPIFEDILFEERYDDGVFHILEINNNLLLIVMKGSINNQKGVYYSTINLLGEYLQEPTFITDLEKTKKWRFEDSTTLTNGLISNLYTYTWETESTSFRWKTRQEGLFGITFNSDWSLYGNDYIGVTSSKSCSRCSWLQIEGKILSKISISPLSNGRSIIHLFKSYQTYISTSTYISGSLCKKLLDENFYGEVETSDNYVLFSAIVTDNYIFEFGREIINWQYGKTAIYGPQEVKVYNTNNEYIGSYDYSEFPAVNIVKYYKIDNNNYLMIHNSNTEDFDFSFTVQGNVYINVQGNEYNFHFKGGSTSSSKYEYYINYDKMYNNIYFDEFTKSNNRRYISRLDYSNDINTPLKLYTPQPGTEPDYSITGNVVPTQTPTKAPTQSPTKAPTLAPTHYSSVVSDTSHPTLAPTQGNVDSENGNLPNNDNDELHDEESPGESPGENPDEEQGNTDEEKDKEKSNSEGLTIGLSVSLAVVSILFAASCYLYSKGVVWKYTKEGSNTTSVEFSLGKGSNNSSKDVKIEEVVVQY